MPGAAERDALVAAHERRLRALDPLLPTTQPLPEQLPEERLLAVNGAVGLARRIRTDLDTLAAAWTAADHHRLIARVGGDDPVAAMDALLGAWREQVLASAGPGDPDSAAVISWPSRDTAMTTLFLGRGLTPRSVVAVRPAGRPAPVGVAAGSARVHPLTAADLDAAVDLHMQEVRWDAQFGGMTERASTEELVRREYRDVLGRAEQWTWIVEADGGPAGLIAVTPPARSGWVAPITSAAPAAYVSCMVVDEARRGDGLGAALVSHAHAALDRAGVSATLLHYSGLNPLSVPFWHRCGYRPLWTAWELRPASALR
jgi:GNAT superfamily N-acetyltransferase